MIEVIGETGGLGDIEVVVPGGTSGVTPASRLMLEAIGRHRDLLGGEGIDWGSGSGCLAIAAGRITTVDRVVAIEQDPAAVDVARDNAVRNGVGDVVSVIRADLFEPFDQMGRAELDRLNAKARFLIANPPASSDDDGLGWRRRLLAGARRFLVPGSPVILQISAQYGQDRIAGLSSDVAGYRYHGLLESTGLVPFDQRRADLVESLRLYAGFEKAGGRTYVFVLPDGTTVNATAALSFAERTGGSPLSRWQAHLYRWDPGRAM